MLFKIETSKVILDLQKEVAVLKERLSKYESPKNSKNSSITLAGTKHPRDKKLNQAAQAINKAYKNLGSDNEHIEQPDIT